MASRITNQPWLKNRDSKQAVTWTKSIKERRSLAELGPISLMLKKRTNGWPSPGRNLENRTNSWPRSWSKWKMNSSCKRVKSRSNKDLLTACVAPRRWLIQVFQPELTTTMPWWDKLLKKHRKTKELLKVPAEALSLILEKRRLNL